MSDRRFKKGKVCTKCNQLLPLSLFYYNRRRKQRMNTCKVCNSEQCMLYQRRKREELDPRRIFMSRSGDIRRRARIANVPIMDQLGPHLVDLWEKCQGKCHYTGQEMKIFGRDHDSVTVDRIVPKLGYVEGNIVLCTHIVNSVKQDLSLYELVELVEHIKLTISL